MQTLQWFPHRLLWTFSQWGSQDFLQRFSYQHFQRFLEEFFFSKTSTKICFWAIQNICWAIFTNEPCIYSYLISRIALNISRITLSSMYASYYKCLVEFENCFLICILTLIAFSCPCRSLYNNSFKCLENEKISSKRNLLSDSCYCYSCNWWNSFLKAVYSNFNLFWCVSRQFRPF